MKNESVFDKAVLITFPSDYYDKLRKGYVFVSDPKIVFYSLNKDVLTEIKDVLTEAYKRFTSEMAHKVAVAELDEISEMMKMWTKSSKPDFSVIIHAFFLQSLNIGRIRFYLKDTGKDCWLITTLKELTPEEADNIILKSINQLKKQKKKQ